MNKFELAVDSLKKSVCVTPELMDFFEKKVWWIIDEKNLFREGIGQKKLNMMMIG